MGVPRRFPARVPEGGGGAARGGVGGGGGSDVRSTCLDSLDWRCPRRCRAKRMLLPRYSSDPLKACVLSGQLIAALP